ncbi:hypothetical protein ANN_26607 [Periplaneta americana]|uniref:Uncharacterized protein n=1 Tax=Periplaneta americana TaxID=6978 RepID=A0ABQ8RYJ1_PERAM|nr:hypothetical protein ANN_26607 [Periplaneta americana]
MGDSGTSSVLTRYEPCDYDLFTKVKELLRGTRYNTRDELIRALRRSIRNINKDGGADGVRRLPVIWKNVINKRGDYIEVSGNEILNTQLSFRTHSLTLHYTTRTHPHRKQNKRRQDQQRPVLRMTHKRSKHVNKKSSFLLRDSPRSHCLAKGGSSRRVDIIAIDRRNVRAIIIDHTVRFETAVEQPVAVHEEKKTIYDPTIQYFRDYYHIQGQIEIFGLLFGARGTIPKFSVECFKSFGIPLNILKIIAIDEFLKVVSRYMVRTMLWFQMEKDNAGPAAMLLSWTPDTLAGHVLQVLDALVVALRTQRFRSYFFPWCNVMLHSPAGGQHHPEEDYLSDADIIEGFLRCLHEESSIVVVPAEDDDDIEMKRYLISERLETCLIRKWGTVLTDLAPPATTRFEP